MDRDRGRRFEDRGRSYGAEAYRPSERSARSPPPRSSNFRNLPRSPLPARRGRTPPYDGGYAIRGRADDRVRSRSPRRRSRSPVTRAREDDTYRPRLRSPTREHYERPRSPPRRRSRSPFERDRSPLRPRRREPSLQSTYRARSPPPKSSRYADDRDGFDRRDYLPREEPRRFPRENNYRPGERVRSPPRRSTHTSGNASPSSRPLSRRASPPVHPDRLRQRSPEPYSDRRSPPPQYYPRDPSPPPRRARSPPPQSPEPEREALSYRDRTPPPRDYAPPMKESIHRDRSPPREPQSSTFYSRSVGPAYDAELRAPPTGPSSSRYDNQIRDGPPTGPSYRGEPVPNYSRPSPSGPSSMPPSRPRNGNPAPYRDTYREFPSSRGGRPPGQATRRSPPSVPTGPRGSSTGISYEASTPSQPRWSTPSVPRWSDRSPAGPPSSGPPPPFRGSNNSTSTTYPRTQRFNTGPASHLSSIPPIIEGGKKLPSLMDSEHERKLAQIEDEKRRLEGMIEEKQRAKRAGLREWERLERESKRDALRSELAEGHLERLSGEVGGGGGGGY